MKLYDYVAYIDRSNYDFGICDFADIDNLLSANPQLLSIRRIISPIKDKNKVLNTVTSTEKSCLNKYGHNIKTQIEKQPQSSLNKGFVPIFFRMPGPISITIKSHNNGKIIIYLHKLFNQFNADSGPYCIIDDIQDEDYKLWKQKIYEFSDYSYNMRTTLDVFFKKLEDIIIGLSSMNNKFKHALGPEEYFGNN